MANQGLLIAALAEAFATASGIGGSGAPLDTRANRQYSGLVEISVERAGSTGGGTVYGVNLPHKQNGAASAIQIFLGSDGTTGRTVFTTSTDMPYAAFSNYNYIVLLNGVVLVQGAGAGKYQISDGTNKTVITLGTAAAVNDVLEVYFVTPVAMYTFASAAITFKKTQVQGKELIWYAADSTTAPSSTNVYVRPVARAA